MKVRVFFQVLLFALLPFTSLEAGKASPETANTTAAGAVAATGNVPRTPDFLEHLVDESLKIFDLKSGENTWLHFAIAAVFLIAGLLLRRVVTGIIFAHLRKLAARTRTTLDDKLFPALEAPTATFIMLAGIFCALKVLKLSVSTDLAISTGSRVAFSLVIFWALLRAFNALLDHAHEIAVERKLSVAAFMPWIKKTLVVVFVTIGTLMVIQNLGYGESVKTVLAGLGIGGLAFALAAQDTIANLFGSIVVAIDQPFRLGEAVKIGSNEGVVEDIGLRSTKLRTPARNLIIIPNKTVASEAIINNSRFIGRRVEQVIGLTYDTSAAQMGAIVDEIRRIITAEAEVDPASIHVYFRDYSASSLDIWLAYNAKSPDFAKSMALRQRINLAIMNATQNHGLDFAFPTQTLHLPDPIKDKIAALPDASEPKK
ncbi:MAG TPA: mechanosensitive ion channel family protein [Lacunisphaera sp.]|jgi:MscS family membrane protein